MNVKDAMSEIKETEEAIDILISLKNGRMSTIHPQTVDDMIEILDHHKDMLGKLKIADWMEG